MLFVQLEPVIEADEGGPVPVPSPVTVEDWVKQGRINPQTATQQPELLQRQLNAAVDRCQDWCMRSFMSQKLKAWYVSRSSGSCGGCGSVSPGSQELVLPRGGVVSVESVAADGSLLDPTGYTIEGNVITLAVPARTAAVVWLSGFGATAAFVPDAIKEGIYEYATVLFEYRAGERPGNAIGQGNNPFVFMPSGIQDILRPYQIEPGA